MTVDKSGIFTDLGRMDAINQLLTVATAFQAATGVSTPTLSWRVFGDSKKLAAIRGGADIQVRRHEKAMQWFSDSWPEGAAWPTGIARPEPSRAVAENGAAA